MSLVVTEHAHGPTTVVQLDGALDLDSADVVYARLDDLFTRSMHRIVVDLAGLEFCDSIGLSKFVVAHHRCAANGGYLRLAAPREFLARVLAVVGLRAALQVYASVPAACAGDPAGLLPATIR